MIHTEKRLLAGSQIICTLSGKGRRASCEGYDMQENDKHLLGRNVDESEEEQSKDFQKTLQ